MDNRCPLCGKDLGRKRLAYAVIARIDMECPHCRRGLSMNLHRGETAIVILGTGSAVVLLVLSLYTRSQALLLAALGVGAAAAGAELALERFWLRRWPRYVARRTRQGVE